MKLAVIPPVPHLDLTLDLDYHLMLAHLALQDPSGEYRTFYKRRREAGEFVILDNSAYELGAAVGHVLLLDLVHLVEPDEVVLPDVLYDHVATLNRAAELHRVLQQAELSVRTMFVPQGVGVETWNWCLKQGVARFHPDTIGIGKTHTRFAPGAPVVGRLHLVRLARAAAPSADIHLLGLQYPSELDIINRMLGPGVVRGVDTCLPIEAARAHVTLQWPYGVLFRPKEWAYQPENPLGGGQLRLARQNIQVLRGIAGGSQYA